MAMRMTALIFAMLVVASAAAVPPVFSTADHANAQRFLDVEFTNQVGAVVIGLLDRSGSRVFAKGKLDNGTDADANAETIFELGSITKVFTSLLALEMQRRGELRLTDPVAKYLSPSTRLPEFEGKPITIGNLARQDSGLPRFPGNLAPKPPNEYTRPQLKRFSDAYRLEDMFAYLARFKLTNAPGSRFVYSNTGMALLGHALAQRLNTTYEAAVIKRIARPLGMTDTRITLDEPQRTRLAVGHHADGSKAENIDFKAMAPAGSFVSTANDMLRFLSTVLGFHRSDLKPTLDEMCVIQHEGSPRFGRTGAPWTGDRAYNPPGSNLLGHGGGGFGYLAFVGFDTLKKRGVVVLTSQMNWSPEGIGWTLLQGLPLTRRNVILGVKEVVGLGFALQPDKASGWLRFSHIFPRSPAGEAGLKSGQLLQKINGVSVKDKPLPESLALLRGKEGSRFLIEITDSEQNTTRQLSLVRRKFITTD